MLELRTRPNGAAPITTTLPDNDAEWLSDFLGDAINAEMIEQLDCSEARAERVYNRLNEARNSKY